MSRSARTSVIALALAGCLMTAAACSNDTSRPEGASTLVAPATAAPTTPRTPAPALSSTAPSGSFTFVATGDVLLHPQLWVQARQDARPDAKSSAASATKGSTTMDFAPMLAGVRPYVRGADLAVCHLETPLASPSGPFSGYPNFSGPPQIASALASTGYDACSTASNHTLDQGSGGISRTLTALDAARIQHTGSARTEAESGHLLMLKAAGTRVAYLSYAYGFNGHTWPGGQTWRANKIDPDRIVADAARARKAGAQIVILALHWGTEYQQTPSAQQLQLAPRLARSGAIDLIISHHSHVVEPIQRIGKVWVVYGLGNLIAFHSTPGQANQEGLLVRFTFTRSPGTTGTSDRWQVTRAEYLPLLVTRAAPIRLLSVPAALKDKDYGSSSRTRLTQALTRTTQVVTSMDAASHGLTRIG